MVLAQPVLGQFLHFREVRLLRCDMFLQNSQFLNVSLIYRTHWVEEAGEVLGSVTDTV